MEFTEEPAMSGEGAVHRALLESSVLLVTLLFIIAEILRESRFFLVAIALVSIPFVFTMICSVFLMLSLSGTEGFGMGPIAMRWFRRCEVGAFVIGLTFLLATFIMWNLQVPGGPLSVLIIALLTAGLPTASMLLENSAQRRRRLGEVGSQT
jgi:hypothetical protein